MKRAIIVSGCESCGNRAVWKAINHTTPKRFKMAEGNPDFRKISEPDAEAVIYFRSIPHGGQLDLGPFITHLKDERGRKDVTLVIPSRDPMATAVSLVERERAVNVGAGLAYWRNAWKYLMEVIQHHGVNFYLANYESLATGHAPTVAMMDALGLGPSSVTAPHVVENRNEPRLKAWK